MQFYYLLKFQIELPWKQRRKKNPHYARRKITRKMNDMKCTFKKIHPDVVFFLSYSTGEADVLSNIFLHVLYVNNNWIYLKKKNSRERKTTSVTPNFFSPAFVSIRRVWIKKSSRLFFTFSCMWCMRAPFSVADKPFIFPSDSIAKHFVDQLTAMLFAKAVK